MEEDTDPNKRMYELTLEQRGVRRQIRKPTPRELRSERRMKRYKELQKYWKQRLAEIEIDMRTIYLNEIWEQLEDYSSHDSE